MMRAGPLLAAIGVSACAASLGTVGLVGPDADEVGLKLLRPGVTGRSCRVSLIGVPLTEGTPNVREAIAQILAVDREGNVVANAELRWERFLTGIYNRRCVAVHGDLARTVSTVRLPAPPAHSGHPAQR